MKDPSLDSASLDEEVQGLQRLDLEIRGPKSQPINALTARDTVHHRACTSQASTIPIRNVPPEILALIFGACSSDQRERNPILMLVCRVWYQVVMQTPSLWSDIILMMQTFEELPRLWDYATACLSRSGDVPLSISLGSFGFRCTHPLTTVITSYKSLCGVNTQQNTTFQRLLSEDQDEGSMKSAYQCALFMTVGILRGDKDQWTSRWRSLCISVSDDFGPEPSINLWDSIDGPTYNLVTPEYRGTSEEPSDWHPIGFPTLPTLTNFASTSSRDPEQLGLPVSQLQQVHLEDSNASNRFLHSASSSFHALQVLQLWVHEPREGYQEVLDPHLDLPLLTALSLRGRGHEAIFAWMRAPRLTHLSIRPYHWVEYVSSPALSNVTHLLWDARGTGSRSTALQSLVLAASALRRIHLRETYPNLTVELAQRWIGGISSAQCVGNPDEWPYMPTFSTSVGYMTIRRILYFHLSCLYFVKGRNTGISLKTVST